LVNFWTYTCINWLRQLPYVRAWAAKYSGRGAGSDRRTHPSSRSSTMVTTSGGRYRICVSVTQSRSMATTRYGAGFGNHNWAALYFADAQGRIRHHYLGEEEYQRSEMIIQQLLGTARDLSKPSMRVAAHASVPSEVGAESPA
jgi:hypothetical protein